MGDKEAARRGREVYLQSLLQHSFGVMDALLMGLCIPNFYQPLVFSRQSLSTKLARKRYMDTGALVFSWYLGDAWEKESLPARMIRRVNAMPKSVAVKVRPLGLEALAEEASEVLREVGAEEDDQLDEQDLVLLESVKDLREEMEVNPSFYEYVNDSVLFSEMDMTMVQGAFVGQFLLFNSHYGFGSNEQELSDFLHLWRVHAAHQPGVDVHGKGGIPRSGLPRLHLHQLSARWPPTATNLGILHVSTSVPLLLEKVLHGMARSNSWPSAAAQPSCVKYLSQISQNLSNKRG